WLNFYSPETRRNHVQASLQGHALFKEELKSSPTFLQTSWIERPESSYRGMYRSGGLETQKPNYHLSADRQTIPDLPTRIYSTGSIGSEWEVPLNPDQVVEFDLHDPGTGRLEGSLTYLGAQELTEWFVA